MLAQDVVEKGWGHGRLTVSEDGDWDEFAKFWEDLPKDQYVLASHGSIRYRRIGHLLARGGRGGDRTVEILPNTAFLQSTDVNSVYGGQVRTFAPLLPEAYDNAVLRATLGHDLGLVRDVAGDDANWMITAHFIRIVAPGRTASAPAPEGRHNDGHDYIVMHLVGRANCAGGHSALYRKGEYEPVLQATLLDRLETIALDDRAMEHEVSPICSADSATATRDMLIVDFDRLDGVPEPGFGRIRITLD